MLESCSPGIVRMAVIMHRGYEPDTKMRVVLGMAIGFSMLLDRLEPFEKEKL